MRKGQPTMVDFLNWFFLETYYGILCGVLGLIVLIGTWLFVRSRQPEDETTQSNGG